MGKERIIGVNGQLRIEGGKDRGLGECVVRGNLNGGSGFLLMPRLVLNKTTADREFPMGWYNTVTTTENSQFLKVVWP